MRPKREKIKTREDNTETWIQFLIQDNSETDSKNEAKSVRVFGLKTGMRPKPFSLSDGPSKWIPDVVINLCDFSTPYYSTH